MNNPIRDHWLARDPRVIDAFSSGRTIKVTVHESPDPGVRQAALERATLKGKPYGDEKCDNCLYYLNPDDDISYCWHQQLRILVGAEWWCQWWEKIPED